MTTFTAVLDQRLRDHPGQPLVTYYDESTTERVELSVTTYANWVAKAAGLLEEQGLERGDRLCVDLPPHWLGTVFLGAAWLLGLEVCDPGLTDAVVCGPGTLGERAAAGGTVLACSLLPMGVRFTDPLPAGVCDVGVEIWAQPDGFAPVDPAGPDDPAVRLGPLELTQSELWRAAAAGSVLTSGGRLVSEANPASPPGLASLTEPLTKGGSLVLVAHAGRDRLEAIEIAEHGTARFPA